MSRTTFTEVHLDRAHRFEVGDRVRHADEEPNGYDLSVTDLNWRVIVSDDDIRGIAVVPTYTLLDEVGDEVFPDVLCTLDLVLVAKGG